MPVRVTDGDKPRPPLIWTARSVVDLPTSSLKPFARNSRRHGGDDIARLANSIATFGFVVPIVVDKDGAIICGHGRLLAALDLGLETVPTICVNHLTDSQVRALRIADNRLAELSTWDDANLQAELGDLADLDLAGALDFDLTVTGFDTAELDVVIVGAGGAGNAGEVESVEKPDPTRPAVTRPGDIWELGPHRLLCGDALKAESYRQVLLRETAQMVFTDPPYNVPVLGHVRSGRGAAHREFAMASGEMTGEELQEFLLTFLVHLLTALAKGGIAMVCMDWRSIRHLIFAGLKAGFELINLCVWNKTNGGMGSLYRSKHELVCIFKTPGAAHVNNVELGRHGRNRTNVWDYAGVNSFGRGRAADLADHPTVKPTALVADAIMDVSHRGDIVLDAFGGSGATLLAAERTGRRARLIELDPLYLDLAIRRWQALTGKAAVHSGTGETFDVRARSVDAAETEGGSNDDA